VKANVFELVVEPSAFERRPGYEGRSTSVRRLLGGERVGMTVYELPPGESVAPYHYEHGNEEWLIVLSGRPTLRTPEGECELEPWETVFFPEGEAGAHKVTNRTGETLRVAMWSTRVKPCVYVYPDSGKLLVRPPGLFFRLEDADGVGYWDGEPPST
jgi:uncharacterized cupin superfamily protein